MGRLLAKLMTCSIGQSPCQQNNLLHIFVFAVLAPHVCLTISSLQLIVRGGGGGGGRKGPPPPPNSD